MSVEQKPLVQEVIEAAGSRLCTFLLKYHCELNFIEFFWSAVKRYFCENCDYTFKTPKTNLPSALWKHHMHMWMEAYWSGLETKEAQLQVREFSSKKYKSDRCVPETMSLFEHHYLHKLEFESQKILALVIIPCLLVTV